MKAGKEGPMRKNFGIRSPLAVDIFGVKKRKAKKKALAAIESFRKSKDKKTTGKVTDQDIESAKTSVKKSRSGRVDLNTKESKREISQTAQDIANKNKKTSGVKKKSDEKVKETRTETSITKSKGGKSSTYNMDNKKTTTNKDGSKNYTFTNDQGNSIKETHGSKRDKAVKKK